MAGGRFRELLKKYGKVALGVHFSVSAASISGLYIAIKNNVDVESLLAEWHLPGLSSKDPEEASSSSSQSTGKIPLEGREVHHEGGIGSISNGGESTVVIREEGKKERNRTAELAASSGGALALAVLCNKALFPIRVPITIALTPPVARFLARRRIFKTNVWKFWFWFLFGSLLPFMTWAICCVWFCLKNLRTLEREFWKINLIILHRNFAVILCLNSCLSMLNGSIMWQIENVFGVWNKLSSRE